MSLSLAKCQSLATARLARRAAEEARHARLRVPQPFRDAPDFLAAVRALAGAQSGANRQIADACKVNNSTVSKWLLGRKTPSQAALDHIAAWWRSHRDQRGPIASDYVPAPRTIRNVKPMDYLIQLLDRQLPRLEEML